MEDLLFKVDFIPQILYLALILLVIGLALRDLSFIQKWMIIWILIVISLLTTVTFRGLSFKSFCEAFISTSLAVMIYDIYKQSRIGIMKIKHKNK